MSTKACQHENLARSVVAHIQRCVDCGCVSIHVGHATVRVDDHGLEALWAVLGDACATLHARQVQGATAPRAAFRGVA